MYQVVNTMLIRK